TRFSRDWSSDVCSSDLGTPRLNEPMSRRKVFRYWAPIGMPKFAGTSVNTSVAGGGETKFLVLRVHLPPTWHAVHPAPRKSVRPEIGRASCREGVQSRVG